MLIRSLSQKINNVQKLIFISERTAEYILSNIGEVEKTTIKNDLKNLFLNKELQIRYNFVLLHPICFKIDERKKVATYTRLTDINEEILNTLKESEIDSIDLRGSYATKILTNGIEIRDVADTLGHRNVETTENYYISSTEKSKRLATDVFDKITKSEIIEEIIKYE